MIRRAIIALTIASALVAASPLVAQRGGFAPPRLDILIDSFKLTRDQERAVKTIMDDANKAATPIRDGLLKGRPAIVAAIQSGKGQAEIDAAVNAYAVHAAAMTNLEMQSLAKIMETLTPEQRANQNAARTALNTIRNAFINKNWNEAPNPDRAY